MTLKVRIGSAYQRRSYEWRDRNGQYQALRPPLGRDAELLQAALLRKPTVRDALEILLRVTR